MFVVNVYVERFSMVKGKKRMEKDKFHLMAFPFFSSASPPLPKIYLGWKHEKVFSEQGTFSRASIGNFGHSTAIDTNRLSRNQLNHNDTYESADWEKSRKSRDGNSNTAQNWNNWWRWLFYITLIKKLLAEREGGKRHLSICWNNRIASHPSAPAFEPSIISDYNLRYQAKKFSFSLALCFRIDAN